MTVKQLLSLMAVSGFGNFTYQVIFGPGDFMAATERTYFMWLALLVARWYCRVTKEIK